MLKNKFTLLIALLIAIAGFLTSCTYEWIEYPEPDPIDTTVVISFSTQIEPIFNNGNYCTSCHGQGGTAPNLITGNAYTSITSMGLVVTKDPTASKIYYYIEPKSSTHSWKKYTASDAQLISTWIIQGALNN
jgi:hypothetical protein